MDMDEFSDETARELPGDILHLPGGYHESLDGYYPSLCPCVRCLGERSRTATQQSAADFVARNRDWLEYARGWSGL